MAIIVGGNESGLLDSSLALLNRGDRSQASNPGQGEQIYVNAANGNLLIQQRDIFLPSFGEDFSFVRTYNSRGTITNEESRLDAPEHQVDDPRWQFSTGVFLEWARPEEDENPGIEENYFWITYGDGSKFEYIYDQSRGLWVSTDGAGAYETLELTRGQLVEDDDDWDDNRIWYTVTRSDQTQYSFDAVGRLRETLDTNGVAMTYEYGGNDLLSRVLDDSGHVLRFSYDSDRLVRIRDENDTTLVRYAYDNEDIVEVTDRFGHSTRYTYNDEGLITHIRLPEQQVVDGQTQTFDRREIELKYERLEWDSGSQDDIDDVDSKAWVVREIIDAEGGSTTFEYNFEFQDDPTAARRFFGHYDRAEEEEYPGNGVPEDSVDPYSHFTGGTTTMVDALGNNRAFSNEAEYTGWRLANGYYETYSAGQAGSDPNFQAQVDAIRTAHSLTYSYRADGYLTAVVDQQGFETTYQYDAADNLIAVTDRNGYGAINSDSNNYRDVRKELGIVDAAGNGKLVAELTTLERQAIIEAFTSHFDYDDDGNLLSATDNADNVTTFTYTDFNKTASITSALGNALAGSDEQQYQDKRIELGYAALVADLSAGDLQAILDLHTTFFDYDTNQNLIERRDPGGDISRFEYDANGNRTRQTVFLDPGDLSDPAQQQVTEFAYDAFGNNTRTVDAEGNVTHSAFDHYGNLTQFIDGNGGVTSFTYDADNRLLTVTDPEGHITANTYDAVGNRISVTDANGNTITRVFDRNNNLIATLDPSEIDVLQDRTTQFEYDVVGSRTAVVNAEGRRTEFIFNQRRELVESITAEVVGADGTTPTSYSSTFAYDGEGNRILTTNNRGFATEILYTQNNLVRQQTDPNGQVTRLVYDANNNQIQITAGVQLAPALRQVLSFSYDEENQIITQTDAEGNVAQFAYDAPGNRIAVTDANGNTTDFEYDGNNRLVREIFPEVIDPVTQNPVRYTVEHIFDANGNEIETIDENGNSTRFVFDRDDKLVLVEDSNGIKTVFEYDSRENRTAVIIGADATVEEVTSGGGPLEVLLSADDFEAGFGNYVDGGSDASLYTGGTYAHQGNNAAKIQDNSGESSSFTHSQGYDISGFDTLEIDFWYYARDMEDTEDFWVQLWNGSAWQTVATFAKGVDFENDEFKQASISLSSTDYNFATDARVRFVADASSNSDDVYIDEIEVRGSGQAPITVTKRINVASVDNAQFTRFVYDEFNQVVAEIDGVGNALAESDATLYQQLRQELGFAAQTADLSVADQQALRELYTRHFAYDRVGNQISTIDSLDRLTGFQYDALNRLVASTSALGDITRFAYDGNSNRVSQTDAEGRVARFAFDSVDLLTDATDPLNVVTRSDYDSFGNLTAQTRAFGTVEARTSGFVYDLNNRVIAQTDPEGHTQSFEYDAVGNRIRLVDGRGNDTQFIFNALNRNVKILDPLSFETRLEYDGVGNLITLVDANGGSTRFVYDPANRRIQTTDAEGRSSTFSYDVRGNQIELRTAAATGDEEITLFEYDAENNLRRVIDAEGGITERDYDRVYNNVATTDANGHTTVTEFDAVNRLIRTTDAENQVTEFGYDAVGNQVAVTDSLGRITQFVYDDNDRLIRQIAADNVEVHFSYDLVGNRASITRAANTADAATDTFVYDLDDRLVSQTDAEGNTTIFAYDENNNRTVVTDPNGNASVFSYDANNRVTQIQDPENNIVSFTYDSNGNRTQVIDGRGNATTTYYNANNEVIVSVDAEGYATSLVYDNNGNVLSQTLHMQALALPLNPADPPVVPVSAADQTILLEYDKLNRVTARVDGEGFRTEFVYDAVGNRLEARQFRDLAGTDIAVTRSYYDDVDRQIASVTAEGYLTEVTYDAVGNVTARTLFDERVVIPASGVPVAQAGDPGRAEQFVYDLVNRQVRATSALGVHTDFEYDDRGNRTAIAEAADSGDQRRTEFAYDSADRLIDTVDALGTITHLTLDANGNTVARREAFGTPDERLTSFVFDGNNRIVSQTDALGVVADFVYDANGNLVSRTLAAGLPEARIETGEFDRNNRVIAEVNGEGERAEFTYDGAGNRIQVREAPGLTEERTTLFEYDRDNRLVGQTDGEGVRTEFRYDGAGNRTETIAAVGVPGEERHSFGIFDLDNRLLQAVDPLGASVQFEYDVLGNRIRVVDENGGEQLNDFDIIGRLIGSQTAGGTLTRNSYDLRNNLLSVTTSFTDGTDSRVITLEYDLLDRQVRSTNGNGYSTDTVYDVFGNLLQVTRGLYLVDIAAPDYDPNKAVLAFPQSTFSAYDAVDRLVSSTDAQGTETTFGYDAVGNRTRVIDGANVSGDRLTTLSYDLANRLVESVDPEGGIIRNAYNALGQIVQKSILQSDDGLGNQVWIDTFFEYDDDGRLVAQIDGEGVRFEFQYDAVGNQVQVLSAVGTADQRASQTEYDLNNRISAEIDGEGNRSEFAYDSAGNRIRVTDPRGGVTRFYYDADNRLTNTLNAAGYITEFDYDSIGSQVTVREFFAVFSAAADDFIPPVPPASATDRISSFVYDRNGQLVERTETDGAVYQFSYDGVGSLVAEIDALGRETTYAYDLNNRLTVLTDANGTETRYAYDLVGNRTAIVRGANTAEAATELFSYDLNNRLIREVDGLGNARRTFAYDKTDNRLSETDANGNTLTFAYDLNNRVTDFGDGEGNITSYAYDAVGNRTREIDGRNNSEIKFYNDNNQVTHLIDREGFVTTFDYDANGNIISQTLHMLALALPVDSAPVPVVSADDQITQFEYDSLNRVTAQIDAEGFRTEFVFDAAGNQLQIAQYRDLAGTDTAVTHRYFDAMNREIARVSAEGYLTVFEYDAESNRTARIRFDQTVPVPASGLPTPMAGDTGRMERFAYDGVDRLARSTSVLGVDTDFEYDSRGNRTATVEAAGTGQQRRTEFLYDAADRLTDTIDALGVVTHLTLDGNGNVVEQRDAFGAVDERLSTFGYDGNNRTVTQTDATGVTTTMAYDANGNLVGMTSALGLSEQRTETFEYDRNNRRTGEVNGEGERAESIYDGAGNRIGLILAPGLAEERSNTFEFDRDNRLVAGVDGEGVRTEYRYDGAGNKIETIQAVGVAGQERHSLYVYDLDNRLTQVIDPVGGVTHYTYDVLGNQTEIIDANGGVQTSSFDALGRLVSSVSAGGVLTANTYDLRGNIVSATQSFADGTDSRTTTYGYDLLDRQVLVTDPEGFSTSIEYDAFGNQVLVTHGQYRPQPGDADAAKAARAFEQTNGFTYDGADRLLSLTDGEGNIITYAYDAVGNRTSFTEASNSEPRTTAFTYDLADRLLETLTPEGGISRNNYDKTGNRVSEAILQSDDGITQVWINTSFEYDDNARVTAQIDPFGVRTEFEYDAMGNQTLVRAAAGTADERVTRREYDLNNRTSAEIDGEGNRSEFEYDSLGNRIKVTDALSRVARFYFDGNNNLISILDAEGFVNAFGYDSAGNRIGETVYMTRYTGPVDDFVAPVPTGGADDRISSSALDGNSRVIERVESDGSTTTFEYDAAGNLTREVQFTNSATPRVLTYGYDLNNRLATFTDVDGTVTTFTYDGANNKTSETISAALDPNTTRQTTFEYDLNNRLVREVFDPAGLNLVQSIEYDLTGNAIANTDANGNVTRSEYDLNNRAVRRVDGLNNDTLITYDAVGNQTTVTDANGNVSTFVYNNNNRVVVETLPSVTLYTIDGGFVTELPVRTHAYDAAGNETQSVDAVGNITTRYFDSNDRLVAELSGDNVLREWTYNATGEQLSETRYMTRLAVTAHDPAQRPAAPAGDSRTTTVEYDLAGRVTRITHPAVEVTTLVNADTASPGFVTVTVQPEELFTYDAFGNRIDIVDRNGNRTLAYYDAKDRLTAQVDAEGYLTEFDYDAQDNVLEQRNYTQRLDTAALDPDTRPAPPAGEVYQTNRIYDAASRLIEEHSPQVETFDPAALTTSLERVVTQFTYDGAGNQISRTLAAGSSQAFTEYSYYDALNRQVALVDGSRVVNVFGFDANGNQTFAKRYFNTLAAGVDPAALDGTTNFAALVGGNSNDQEINRLYDALNRLSTETELMGAGSADDLVKSFGYDANGTRTRAVDEDGFVQQFSYDANRNLIRSVSPDNSGTVYEYDAAGNQIFAFTGQLDSIPLPAANASVTLGAALTFEWSLPAGAQSYVVYDTASHTDLDSYANQSAVQGTWFSESGSVSVPADSLAAGDTLYFRVVTQDAVGSLTWTAEQSVSLPPRINDVAVEQAAADTLEITVQFDAGAVGPALAFGMPGSTNTIQPMTDLGGGLFRATLSGITNPQELAYRIQWQDGAGAAYASDELPFEAQGDHLGVTSQLTESTVVVGADTFYRVNVDTTLPADLAGGLLGVAATWVNTADATITGSASVEGVDSGLGFFTYPLVVGAGDSPLEAGTYTVTLRTLGETEDTILDSFEVTVGNGLLTGTERSASWTVPDVGDSQVVIVDGQRTTAVREGNRLVVDPGLSSIGSVVYSAFYGSAFSDTHTTTVTSTEITETDDTTMPPTVTVLGYDVNLSAVLSVAEAANVSGDVRLAWRAAASGTEFANDLALTATGSTFATTLALLTAGEYDLKVYYSDANGDEVIVDWLRVDTAAASTDFTDNSVTVAAREVDGDISLSADDVVTVDPGLYSGPLPAAAGELTLQTVATGNPGGSIQQDGSDTGYFAESRYDALNNLIATNAETGVWREFGVDANGNRVLSQSFGDEGAPDPIVSLTAYDGRDREVAQFAPEVNGGSAITRFEYDLQDNITLAVDALGGETRRTWNALGSQLTEQDQLFNTTTFRYDRLGRNTAEIDALGKTQYKRYDSVGNLIQTIDGKGDAVSHTYDVFGRRIQMSNALGQSVAMTYDQRDRLVRADDALGLTTRYEYDGRNNRTATVDANGNESRQVWDGLGRVTDTITFQNGQQIREQKRYDAYGNLVAEIDGAGRITTRVYGAFGRLLQQIDAGGRITAFEYDDQGRVTREFGLDQVISFFGTTITIPGSGKDIRRSYDDAGRLLEVNDVGTSVRTVYTYDLAGKRLTEVVTTPDNAHNRNVSYQYDAIGQMVRWADAVTGMHTNYMWDAAGNLSRAFTDLGYDPDSEGLPAGTRFVDHDYSYDANNRVTQQTQRGAIEVQYSYDAAGNRVMVNNEGTVTDYVFDANGRVIRAESGGTTTADWQYDNVGNVTRFRTFDAGGSVDKVTTKQYHENNRNFFTNDDGQQTTLTLDRAGNVTRSKLVDDGDTFYFDHVYNASGQETRINARGKDVGGRTVNTYDANDNLVVLDKGEGDNQDRNEILRFVYNTDGQILYRFNDTGKGSDIFETEFAYANSNPVGQTGATEDAASETLLDTGQYNLIQPLGEDFPNSAVTFVTASAGDTLQGIAAAVYGNPSLWFVLAEANGIAPGEQLTEGQRLQVPNTVKTGALTADTHVVYDEGDIIGSSLPNLKSDPKDDGCGSFLAIIIIVIIAVVAVIATAGLATAFLGGAAAAASASVGAQVAAFALAGAIVGAAASIVQQGLFIALGYQDEFNWKSVAAAAVSGAFSGAATGLGNAVRAAAAVGETVKYAKTATAALKIASVASKQLIENGKITSWTSLAAAGVSGALSVARTEQAGAALASLNEGDIDGFFEAADSLTTLGEVQTAVDYLTPWVQLAETAIRNDGKLQPGDWVSAIGATLDRSITSVEGTNELSGALDRLVANVAIDAAVAGALSLYDEDAARGWLESSVGNEVGGFIGGEINRRFTTPDPDAALEQQVLRLASELRRPEKQAQTQIASTGAALEEGGEGFTSPTSAGAEDITTQPGDAGDSPILGVTQDADGDQVQDVRGIQKIKSGDTFWKIARQQLKVELGRDPTSEEIQLQSQILMQLNPTLNPRNFRVGDDVITVAPFSGIEVGPDALARYQESDAEYQEFLRQLDNSAVVSDVDFATGPDAAQNAILGDLTTVVGIATSGEPLFTLDPSGNLVANDLALEAAAMRIRDAGFDNFSLSATSGVGLDGVDQREIVVAFGENRLSLQQLGADEPILRGFLAATESASEQSFSFGLREFLADPPDPAVLAEQVRSQKVATIVNLIQEIGESSRQSLANSNQALEDNNFFEALLIGVGASLESTFDFVVDVGVAIGDGVEFLVDETGEFATEIFSGDTDALTARYQTALETAEGAADFVGSIPEKAQEIAEQVKDITQLIQENPEIYDAFAKEFLDTANDISPKQVTLAIGALVGEILIGAATAGAANAAKAGRGAVAGGKLVDALLDLAASTRTVAGRTTRVVGEAVEGLRAGRLALRSPIILDDAALIGRFNAGVPVDAIKFRNPLTNIVRLTQRGGSPVTIRNVSALSDELASARKALASATDEAAKTAARRRITRASEQLGEAGAASPEVARALGIDPSDLRPRAGGGRDIDLDLVDLPGGRVGLIEAKGGSSRLGFRQIQDAAGTRDPLRVAQQGTRENIQGVVNDLITDGNRLLNSGNAADIARGQDKLGTAFRLRDALDSNTLDFIVVNTRFNASNQARTSILRAAVR